ncbi:hypothetical protein LJR225_005257 [Phenylobacterium sp. LjRoot225]|uniref:hypothetical protein n=1 Tax=Phenylobacterium sp. LjRoot225 TaxID=3342285 RepID=UPI003ECC200F
MSLDLPEDCGLDLVDAVVAERQNGPNAALFTGWAAEWRDRVQAYLDHGGSPEHVPVWLDVMVHKGKFHNLYNSADPESAHGEVLARLREHDLTLCPACGEPGRPNTLDHYLPKGRYPHFSLTPANLFPMCDACQAKKLEKTGDSAEPRYFLHPYFDTFIKAQILKMKIDPPFDKPMFYLAPFGLAEREAALVASHLRELHIPGRFLKFFTDEHRRLLRNVSRMRAKNQDVAATLESFSFDAADPTPNSWQHLFYDAVITNSDLMHYLMTADLPPYL